MVGYSQPIPTTDCTRSPVSRRIFPECFQGAWSELRRNGMTVGALTVIILIQFVELTGPRPRRLKTELTLVNFTKAGDFLSDFAAATGDTNLEDSLALLDGREPDHALRLQQPPRRHQIGAS